MKIGESRELMQLVLVVTSRAMVAVTMNLVTDVDARKAVVMVRVVAAVRKIVRQLPIVRGREAVDALLHGSNG